ncbi:alpha beta-hydrolase [Pyrrhoderma noxium]|uniref:Carboxylic ester hydrolase n=1 Tax=Pyrrhoderma noxium TaxID=2282107 RepID=A0A286UEI5_9AGAM|nr:alpha beta-hydrolase [Pyrrhoderma noxium]
MKHLDYLLCALSLTFPYYGLSAGYPGVPIRNQLDQTTFGVDEPGTSTDVDLGYAIYRGSYNATVDRTDFLGVRYAAPPIGTLRFQAPMPPERVRQSEDCLFLNVFVSGQVKKSEKLPVLVWIHGGGYVLGSSAMHPAESFVSEADGGLVVVVVQYRLGMFGFLSGAEVKEKGALNAGLLDQRRALVWVQDYIHLFGGDPERVTIWGESAGAGSVMQHMIAHGGNSPTKLFSNLITSSIFFPHQYKYNDPIPEKIYLESLRAAGCQDAIDRFRCLADSDTETLQKVNFAVNSAGFSWTFLFTPVVDNEYIIEHPLRTSLRRQFNGRKLLAVTNSLEGSSGRNNRGSDVHMSYIYGFINVFRGCIQGSVRHSPGNHASDLQYYMPGANLPIINDELFENAEFIASFDSGFLGLAKYNDLNVHPVDNVITPQWDSFDKIRYSEMLFNRTEDFKPDIHPIRTDPGLLQRCQFWEDLVML